MLPIEKVKYIIADLKKFNNFVLDGTVKRITVNIERNKKILEDQVASTISIDEQIGRMVLSYVEGKDEVKLEDAEALLREGDSVERVSHVLKLPVEKVQALADKIAAEKQKV